MSSVQVLLSNLQRPKQGHAKLDLFRETLVDLVATCRYEECINNLVCGSGLNVLADFVASDIVTIATSDEVVEPIFELLILLIDNNHNAKTKLAEKPSLFSLPLHCIHVFTPKQTSEQRNKMLRNALEIVESLLFTEYSLRSMTYQEHTIVALLHLLKNPGEESTLLIQASNVFHQLLERSSPAIEVASTYNAIKILLRLISTNSEQDLQLKRQVSALLLVFVNVVKLTPMFVTNRAIPIICSTLRTYIGVNTDACQIELDWIFLLLRISENAQVYEQLLQEGAMTLLFQIVERYSIPDYRIEVIQPTCTLLAGLSAFARSCKLDLLPYTKTDKYVCHGKFLVHAVAFGTTSKVDCDALIKMSTSVWNFLMDMTWNPVHLSTIVSEAVIQDMLVVYLSKPSICPVAVKGFQLGNEQYILPGLFLCLRSHQEEMSFVSRIYAVLTADWSSRAVPCRDASSINGFIKTAVEIVVAHNLRPRDFSAKIEMMELYNFFRVLLEDTESADVVLACGGRRLYAALSSRHLSSVPTTFSTLLCSSNNAETQDLISHVDAMAKIVFTMLDSTITRIDTISKGGHSSKQRQNMQALQTMKISANEEYEAFIQTKLSQLQNLAQLSTTSENELGDEEIDDDGNDDDSSSDSETEMGECENDEATSGVSMDAVITNYERVTTPTVAPCAFSGPRHACLSSQLLRVVDYSHMEDKGFFYRDELQMQFPKHPCRRMTNAHGTNHESIPHYARPLSRSNGINKGPSFESIEIPLLLDDIPLQPEPCHQSDSISASTFIALATKQREEFLSADPTSRACLIYENTSVYEESSSSCMVSTPETSSVMYVASTPLYEFSEQARVNIFSSPSLTFDSWFEGGNLERAIRIGEYEYDLVLRHDVVSSNINTNPSLTSPSHHTQWFYFAISNITVGCKYRFNILNMSKPDSLFNHGLKPVVYSTRMAQEQHIGWRRRGEEIYYFANSFIKHGTKSDSSKRSTYHTLTFTLSFDHTDDTYLIAQSYPYTVLDHQRHIQQLLTSQLVHSKSSRTPRSTLRSREYPIIRHSVLCSTMRGRPCDLLTITDFTSNSMDIQARRAVVLTARVHPGEPQASWIMRGMLLFLTDQEHPVARVLRKLFVFYIIPMLNPDGVFYGNSRCGLSGSDLNRHWHQPSSTFHPTISGVKDLIYQTYKTRGIVFYCDIHGHSRKKNVFLYGCDTKKRPNPRSRQFAKLFSTRTFISYKDCSFKMSRDKETTARVVLTNELKLTWSFTLEASFCGPSSEDFHFHIEHLQMVGKGLGETLFEACVNDSVLRTQLITMEDHTIIAVTDTLMRDGGIICQGKDGKIKSTIVSRRKQNEDQVLTKPPLVRRRSSKQNNQNSDTTVSNDRRKSSTFVSEESREGAGKTSLESITKQSRLKEVKTKKKGTKPTPVHLSKLGSVSKADNAGDGTLRHLARPTSVCILLGTDNGELPLLPPKPKRNEHRDGRSVAVSTPYNDIITDSSYPVVNSQDAKSIMPPLTTSGLASNSKSFTTSPIRFKGAGKQYAAISSLQGSPSTTNLVTTNTNSTWIPAITCAAVGYDADLIQASSIALRNREGVLLNPTPSRSGVRLSMASRSSSTKSFSSVK